MDLVKVKKFTEEITTLKNRIIYIKDRITILNNLKEIKFEGDKGASYEHFLINENSRWSLDGPLEVFKILAIKELNEDLEAHEKQLADFIKKGITDND